MFFRSHRFKGKMQLWICLWEETPGFSYPAGYQAEVSKHNATAVEPVRVE
jgi:hypothetical protein